MSSLRLEGLLLVGTRVHTRGGAGPHSFPQVQQLPLHILPSAECYEAARRRVSCVSGSGGPVHQWDTSIYRLIGSGDGASAAFVSL